MKRKFFNKKSNLANLIGIFATPFFGFIGFAFGSGDNAYFPLWLAFPAGILFGYVFGYSLGISLYFIGKYFNPNEYYE